MSSVQCPQCARPLTGKREEFCPSCGYPLFWGEQPADEEVESSSDMRRVPDEEPGEDTGPWTPPFATPPPRPSAPPPPPPPAAAPTIACPACQEANPATRVLCQRCGALLRAEQGPPPPSSPPPRQRPPRRLQVPIVVVALAVLVTVAIGVLVAALRSGPPEPSPTPTTVRPAALTRVNPRSITAHASSELPPVGKLTYSVRNTLDGDIHTAWNNNSAVRGSGVGETLTYRFPVPLHLVRIDLVNGYAKSAELHADNGRIRGVTIVTDARTFHATLADSAKRQRLNLDLGPTSTVTLRVTSIYPGARYTDLALTEIGFWAAPS